MINKIVGFEHLHRHTSYSLLDGLADVSEYAERSLEVNQKYLCITDHGSLAAVPEQIRACQEYNLTPVFGIEFYKQDKSKDLLDQDLSPQERKEIRKNYHLLALAYNDIGFTNLVQLSSWAYINGFYGKPRINHEQLEKHKEGLIVTSCCYNSEIGQAFDRYGEDAAFSMIEKYHRTFNDNFYLEIMLLDFVKQKPYNAFIVKAHEKYHIPIILTNDCHYCLKEDSKFQRYLLMLQKKTTVADLDKKLSEDDKQDIFELQDTNLWMKSEVELNAKWLANYSDIIPHELFEEAKSNTVKICQKCCKVKIDRSPKLPQIPNANEKLKEEIIKGFKWRNLPKTAEYLKRLQEEYELICRKEFASYLLIEKMFVDKAREISPVVLGFGDGSEAIGIGRGSAVGCLILFCLGITDADPVYHGLLFSRFLNESRGGKTMRLKFRE